jgi:chemotaxis protein histidine kinase CheA
MKSLVEYILEELTNTVEVQEVNESNEKWYRFTVKDLDIESIIDNAKTIAKAQGFYVEDVEGGFKMRVDADKVNKLAPIADFLETKVNGYADSEDEKKKELSDKLKKMVDDMRKDMDDADAKAAEEAEKKAKEEEEAAKKAEEAAKEVEDTKKAAEDAMKANQ